MTTTKLFWVNVQIMGSIPVYAETQAEAETLVETMSATSIVDDPDFEVADIIVDPREGDNDLEDS